MAEVLARVKREFGRNAVILNTRSAREGGILGIGRRACVEITAAPDMPDLPVSQHHGIIGTGFRGQGRGLDTAPKRVARAEGAAMPMSPTALIVRSRVSTEDVLSEVGALKSLVSDLVYETRRRDAHKLPERLFQLYQCLVENAVAERIAQGLIEQTRRQLTHDKLRDSTAVRACLARLLESMLPVGGPIQIMSSNEPVIIALIGPTGVGKTTTIAKLAANLRLRECRSVGMVTIDTYRIAAVEQLRTYAQIIDVPLHVASSPRQLKAAVESMADRDIILIDTAGRSQRDAVKIRDLRRFFDAVTPDEIHLVLSSTASESVLDETIECFRELAPNRVIFTKLDEAVGFGVILNCLQKAGRGLSYLTTGQDVPDDIEVAENKTLVAKILQERQPHPQDSAVADARSTWAGRTGGGSRA